MINILKGLERALFPPSCVLCDNPGSAGRELCAACQADLPHNHAACARCALPLPAVQADASCGLCQQSPPAFDAAFSLYRYAYPVDQLIQYLKFSAKLNIARLLGDLMADAWTQRGAPLPELIIPVPLHPTRLRERGFNQALEVARPLARRLGIPLDYQSCVRRRATALQSALPAKDRRANVKGVFEVVKPINARHVALLDDVMTTGHTLQELSGVLRGAGVEKIEAWVVARATKQ